MLFDVSSDVINLSALLKNLVIAPFCELNYIIYFYFILPLRGFLMKLDFVLQFVEEKPKSAYDLKFYS